MVYRIADNVLSPLGMTTAENYQALKKGSSMLKHYASYSNRKEDDYVASRFSEEQKSRLKINGLTWFESLVYRSIQGALSNCDIDISSNRTLLVVSTTKANIEHLYDSDYAILQPAESVQRVADLLGITTQPLVVCNACISGVAALITAQRLLNSGYYDTSIVVGCDVISHFVISGFQSLKVMSQEPCRPFDIERIGLNLGEAAATIVLKGDGRKVLDDGCWILVEGAIRNDAYHISSPSPKGEGCANAINYVVSQLGSHPLSAVNVHGTATMFNDQMESKAIEASGLSDVPMNTLKGYFGHTLGASGILETIITMHSVEQGELLATRGFNEMGVSGKVNISPSPVKIDRQSFVKVISGFGGCNAAILFKQDNSDRHYTFPCNYCLEQHVMITPQMVSINGQQQFFESKGCKMLTEIYKQLIGSYPKFYKMDRLSQLGFVASELLLKQEQPRKENCSDRAVVLFNHSSSIWADQEYAQSIIVGPDYFPSPSLFVYTLPNIVCGEIALRNGYHAETSFYIINKKDDTIINSVVQSTFCDQTLQSMVTGWIDYIDDNTFEADFKLIKRT